PSFGIYHQLSIFDQQQYRAEVTQNISTAESPGRWLQFYQIMISFKIILFSISTILCLSTFSQMDSSMISGNWKLSKHTITKTGIILDSMDNKRASAYE